MANIDQMIEHLQGLDGVKLFMWSLQGGGNEAVRNSQSIVDPTGDLFLPSLNPRIALVVVINTERAKNKENNGVHPTV